LRGLRVTQLRSVASQNRRRRRSAQPASGRRDGRSHGSLVARAHRLPHPAPRGVDGPAEAPNLCDEATRPYVGLTTVVALQTINSREAPGPPPRGLRLSPSAEVGSARAVLSDESAAEKSSRRREARLPTDQPAASRRRTAGRMPP
jgi:hypothetical protein